MVKGMALNQRLELKLGQNLVMTPQLRQAIKLLELSHQELNAYVASALESNPFLEREEPSFSGMPPAGGASNSPSRPDWEEILADQQSLTKYVQDQAHLDISDPKERLIAQQLMGQLDENGYVLFDIDEMAGRLRIEVLAIETVLKKLQKLDPPGIFARNLRECLELQLAEKNRLDPLMRRLLDHLDLIAKKDFLTLAQTLGVDNEDLIDMVGELRNLDPRPGLHFGAAPLQEAEPDILVHRAEGGEWVIELNPATLPRLIVNQEYKISLASKNKEDKAYISEHVAAANWLVRALDQRAQTVLRVAREVIRRQEDFMEKGIGHFRPLLRREVANDLQLHESTVSRVAANKTIATPKGVFALADFFGTGLKNEGEGGHSAKSVMYLIKSLIAQEKKPLSDEQLVKILKGQNIDIARRTIAKYRENMNIPSSSQRRKQNSLPSGLASLAGALRRVSGAGRT